MISLKIFFLRRWLIIKKLLFEKKCEEIKNYEYNLLNEVKEYICNYQTIKLNDEEINFIARLNWFNYFKDYENEGYDSLQPLPIDFGYMCRLEILFYNNDELIDSYDNDDIVNLTYLITLVQRGIFFKKWSFRFLPLDDLLIKFDEYYNKLSSIGYNEMFKYLEQLNKNNES